VSKVSWIWGASSDALLQMRLADHTAKSADALLVRTLSRAKAESDPSMTLKALRAYNKLVLSICRLVAFASSSFTSLGLMHPASAPIRSSMAEVEETERGACPPDEGDRVPLEEDEPLWM